MVQISNKCKKKYRYILKSKAIRHIGIAIINIGTWNKRKTKTIRNISMAIRNTAIVIKNIAIWYRYQTNAKRNIGISLSPRQ